MPTVHELIFTVQVSNLHLQFSTEKKITCRTQSTRYLNFQPNRYALEATAFNLSRPNPAQMKDRSDCLSLPAAKAIHNSVLRYYELYRLQNL